MAFLRELKEFAVRGNVVDMAVGIVIGAAFGRIVSSLVSDLFTPLIGQATGGADFSNLFVALDGGEYATLAAAQEAGVATLSYGNFLNAVLDFAIVAVALFVFVRATNRLRRQADVSAEVPPATTRKCPFCAMDVPVAAQRCGHCTSDFATA